MAIVGAKACRLHLGTSKAHNAFHARRQDEFYAGQLSWEGWDFQRQQRARTRLTLVFSGVLEAPFRQDLERHLHLRQHSREWDDVPDAHRDRLRWNWRRYKLDRPGSLGYQAWDVPTREIFCDIYRANRYTPWLECLMPRDCLICRDADRTKLVMELIAGGVSDRAIARRLGGLSHTSVARHRQNHIERPAKAIVAAANKGKDVREERDQLVAAAEAGDVAAAWLGLSAVVADLQRALGRVDRAAEAAAVDKSHLALASLTNQLLKGTDLRARLGDLISNRPEQNGGAPFVLNIHFSGGRTQRIEGTPVDPGDPVFDAAPAVPLSIGTASNSAGVDEEDTEAEFDEDV